MIGSGALPEFVRDAVLPDEPERHPPEPRRVDALDLASVEVSAAAAERSLLALEDSLSDVVEVEVAHVRIPASMLEQGPARLLQSALEPPRRYAPLCSRIARFLDLSEDATMVELTRLREPARWSPTGVRGVSTLPLECGPAVRTANASLIRIDPGICLAARRPLGFERVLVLEGGYEDESGAFHRPGDVKEWGRGADYSLSAAAGQRCILASLVFGSGLRHWLRRAIATISTR